MVIKSESDFCHFLCENKSNKTPDCFEITFNFARRNCYLPNHFIFDCNVIKIQLSHQLQISSLASMPMDAFFFLLFCPFFATRLLDLSIFYAIFFQYLRIDCAIFHYLLAFICLHCRACLTSFSVCFWSIRFVSLCFFSSLAEKLVQKCALFHGLLFVKTRFYLFSSIVAFSLL